MLYDDFIFDERYGRSGLDRRSGNDRRRTEKQPIIDTRSSRERRNDEERRDGWVKVSKYHSAFLGIPVEELVLFDQ